jgi:peptidoglycan/xylan/chitin deacetylase (PgdA/CDA1 family)
MYHRVADVVTDPWNLCVSPQFFDDQMAFLQSALDPVPLSEITAPSTTGRSRVAVTFDDGYVDNVTNALPILETRNIPATIFIISGTIDSDREFWWDELEHLMLACAPLPETVRLETSKGSFEHAVGQAHSYTKADQSSDREVDIFESRPGTRLRSYFEIWELCCGLDPDERLQILDALWSWSGRKRITRPHFRPMNRGELREAAAIKLLEFGAHTTSHPRLPTLSPVERNREIIDSADFLERETGTRPSSFSYPFGQHDSATVAIVRDSFDRAVSTRPGIIQAVTPVHELKRLAIENWSADIFRDRIVSHLDQSRF